jgi:CheY-like chemotaxis protein
METVMSADALPSHRSLRVLVIEDNSDAAETLRDLLRLFGHEAEIALSGLAGLAVAGSLQPDVVLCDIGLPGMDGYAVAGSLRSEPATRAARLVALTGYGRESDRQRTQEAGFDLHLVKPLEPLELKRLLEEWAKA